ncbi:MAG TPA: DUF6232 family protein [Candidatus Limnocylindrales bacterium]|nr:DUF6232 family protein [Candidatus Limnocylindrales bacterium]
MEAARSEIVIVTIRPGIDITQTCFRMGNRHFELKALHDLETRHSAHHPLTRNAGLLAALAVLALVFLSPFMRPAGIIATAIVLCGLLFVVFFSAQHRPRRQELWASYHGHTMQIFASDDPWLFGAVERQLHRSIAEVRHGKRQVPPTTTKSAVPHPSTMHPSNTYPGMVAG